MTSMPEADGDMGNPLIWQQRAHVALGRLLNRARVERLPVIEWMISATGTGAGPAIVGRCEATDPAQRVRDFQSWQDALGADPWPNGIERGANLHLHAHVDDYEGADVVIVTDIHASERE